MRGKTGRRPVGKASHGLLRVTGGLILPLASLSLLSSLAACAETPPSTTRATEATPAPPTPHSSGGLLVYTDDGTNTTDVCHLISAERVGEIVGVAGVAARENRASGNANAVGACDYTAAGLELRLLVIARDPTLTPAEYASGATYGKGRAIDGLGEAAALAEYDDGMAVLVVVHDRLALTLTGTADHAARLPQVAKELLPGLAAL